MKTDHSCALSGFQGKQSSNILDAERGILLCFNASLRLRQRRRANGAVQTDGIGDNLSPDKDVFLLLPYALCVWLFAATLFVQTARELKTRWSSACASGRRITGNSSDLLGGTVAGAAGWHFCRPTGTSHTITSRVCRV